MGRPVKTYRCGQVQATIWENDGQNGKYNTVTFKKSYKNTKGEWVDVSSFMSGDLSDVAVLTRVIEQELKLRVVEKNVTQQNEEAVSSSPSVVVNDVGLVE